MEHGKGALGVGSALQRGCPTGARPLYYYTVIVIYGPLKNRILVVYGQQKNRILLYCYSAIRTAKEQDTNILLYGQLKNTILV